MYIDQRIIEEVTRKILCILWGKNINPESIENIETFPYPHHSSTASVENQLFVIKKHILKKSLPS